MHVNTTYFLKFHYWVPLTYCVTAAKNEELFCVLSNPAQTPDPELQLHNTGDLGSGLGSNRHMAPARPGWKCDKEFTEARTRGMLVDSLHWRVFLAFQNNTFPAPAPALAPALGTACEVVRRYGACTLSQSQDTSS